MPTTIFRASCEEKRIIFTFSLTDLEKEIPFGDEDYIRKKVDQALERRNNIEQRINTISKNTS